MMSVVVPAYNEEERMEIMLEEAIEFLDAEYGRTPISGTPEKSEKAINRGIGGYEILIVNDGSTDKTIDVALEFSRKNQLHDILRVCTLQQNRGKGGAVTHGFRHVRGAYTVFADADGASKFGDLRKLVKGCQEVEDKPGRGIAVGSRAHMVGTEAVVKVCTPPSLSRELTNKTPAEISPKKRPNALLPSPPTTPHTPCHLTYSRHPMRIQTLFSRGITPYRSLYARRRLDF